MFDEYGRRRMRGLPSALLLCLALIISFLAGIIAPLAQKGMNRTEVDGEVFYAPMAQTIYQAFSSLIVWLMYAADVAIIRHAPTYRSDRNLELPVREAKAQPDAAQASQSEAQARGEDAPVERSEGKGASQQAAQKGSSKWRGFDGTLIWVVLACMDAICGWGVSRCVCVLNPSTVLLLRTFFFVTTSVMSLIVFKRKIGKAVGISCLLTCIGCALIAWNAVTGQSMGLVVTGGEDQTDGGSSGMGAYSKNDRLVAVVIVLGTCLLTSIRLCADEYLLGSQAISPLKAAGISNVSGIVVLLLLTWSKEVGDEMSRAYTQISSDRKLQMLTLTMCVCCSMLSISCAVVARLSTGLVRSVLHVTRASIVLLIETFLGWSSPSGLQWVALAFIIVGQAYNSLSMREQGAGTVFSEDLRMSMEPLLQPLSKEDVSCIAPITTALSMITE